LLDQLMAEMGACAGQTVFVDGHTDSRGSRASNLRLSERRARAVIEYLARASENPRFETRAFGESRPISSNRTAAGQRRNRRIEFVVVGAGPESE
jgi:OOP family OmpA-OmpF porin